MPKVNPDCSPGVQVHHEVGEVPVPNAQHVVTHAHSCIGAGEVGTKHEEGLG